jgi:hypothetical protein
LPPVSLASVCTSLKTLHVARLVVAVLTTLCAFKLVAKGLYLKADMAKVKKKTHSCCRNVPNHESIIFYFYFVLFIYLFIFWYFSFQYVAFKGNISAAAGALVTLNAQCRTVFSLSVERMHI